MTSWRTIFFAVNFGAALLSVVMFVVVVAEWPYSLGSPFAFLGAAGGIVPALGFCLAEWLLYVRKARSLELPLGVICLAVGALAIFAFLATAAEALTDGEDALGVRFWLIFGSICLTIAIYSFWCGWLRVRQRTFPSERGFPVDLRS